jgi:tetratricopeptide (TPR) repeat protein
VALDPEAYYVRADLALFYPAAGRNQEAAEASARVLDVAPDFAPALSHRLLACERLGRLLEAAETARSLMRVHGAPEVERARAARASPREAVELWRRWDLQRMEAMAGRVNAFALPLALRYAAAGENGEALALLERAHEQKDALLVFLPAFPELDGLRGNPRFEELSLRIRRG